MKTKVYICYTPNRFTHFSQLIAYTKELTSKLWSTIEEFINFHSPSCLQRIDCMAKLTPEKIEHRHNNEIHFTQDLEVYY